MQSVLCAFSLLGAGDSPGPLCSSGPAQPDGPPAWTQPSAALHRSSLLQQASIVWVQAIRNESPCLVCHTTTQENNSMYT